MPTQKVTSDVKRLGTDYIGDVGELKIAPKFVEMGCSVKLAQFIAALHRHLRYSTKIIESLCNGYS